MTGVIPLHGGRIHDPREPNDDLIAALERMLEEARAGEMIGFAGVTQYFDKATCQYSVGAYQVDPVLGRLQRLSFDIMRGAADD